MDNKLSQLDFILKLLGDNVKREPRFRMIQLPGNIIEIVHVDGRKVTWSVKEYSRSIRNSSNEDDADLTIEINGFCSCLEAEEQDRLFEIYREAYAVLSASGDHYMVSRKLMNLATEIYEIIDVEKIGIWMRYFGNVKVPPVLKEAYETRDIPDRTYLKDEYYPLVHLAIAVRAMTPIWGSYIEHIKKDIGVAFKEMEAVRLITGSSLMECAPIKRLRLYVDATIRSSDDLDTALRPAILKGIGTEMLPEWLLATIIVRQLAAGDISLNRTDKGNIITNIDSAVRSIFDDLPKKFDGLVKDRYHRFNPEEDNQSIVEVFKMVSERSVADPIIDGEYIQNGLAVALDIDPTISESKVMACIWYMNQRQDYDLKLPQQIICQYVIDMVISARGVPMLKKSVANTMVATVQALLWHWGYLDLAILVSANRLEGDHGSIAFMETRYRLTPDLQNALDVMYPYRRVSGKVRGEVKTENVAARAAHGLTVQFMASGWAIRAPDALVSEYPEKLDIRFSPKNLYETIVRFILDLGNRKREIFEAI